MKHAKTGMLLAAALALFGAQASWGETVVSSNVVGYNKVTLSHEYTMLGMQFQTVGANDHSLTIGQIVPDANVAGIDWSDDNFPFGASMMLWNGSSYVGGLYYWTGEVPTELQADLKDELELDESVVYNNIWVDGDYMPVDPDLTVGEGFWIVDATANGSGKVNISGEVSKGTCTVSLNAGYTMIANPFPADLNLNSMIPTGVTGIDWSDDNFPFGASIMVWNGSSYVGGLYYWTGEVPTELQADLKDELELDESVVYNNIWVDGDYMPVTTTIPVGSGFWIFDTTANPSSSYISFPAP